MVRRLTQTSTEVAVILIILSICWKEGDDHPSPGEKASDVTARLGLEAVALAWLSRAQA